MKKKKQPSLQKPLLLAGLFLVMIIALAMAIQYLPRAEERPLTTQQEVRSGQQIASVTILPKDGSTQEHGDSIKSEDSMDEENINEGSKERLQFRIDRFQLLATQPLRFQVFDAADNALTPDYLETVQGAKLHFYLVHAGMGIFHHILSDYSDGVWNARSYMPRSGTYYAYVKVDPIKGDPMLLRYDLVVRNESAPDVDRVDPALTASDGAFTSTLEMKRFDDYRGFLYQVQRNGNPVTVVPQHDAIAEMTIFSHGNPHFIRTLRADTASEENIGKVSFSTEHLQPGRYTAFMEAKIDGQTRTFAQTFDIGS